MYIKSITGYLLQNANKEQIEKCCIDMHLYINTHVLSIVQTKCEFNICQYECDSSPKKIKIYHHLLTLSF